MPHPAIRKLNTLADDVKYAIRARDWDEARKLIETQLGPAIDKAYLVPDDELDGDEAEAIGEVLAAIFTVALVVGDNTSKPDKKRITKALKALLGVQKEPTPA